ncbi:MAG: hypothetical protein M1817_000666 [Caeruleum heppii]|nr:MAG: hypothetical protein M1817_000666 [Caeruleum heppii]
MAANFMRLPSGISFDLRRHETYLEPTDREGPVDREEGVGPVSSVNFHTLNGMEWDDYVRVRYLPLLEVDIRVNVEATISRTTVTQTFSNHCPSTINEAKYCFPLYDGSSVISFRCWVGRDKLLEGKAKSKEEAKAEYQAAVSHKRVAALLEEHTLEVFETSLGNVPPTTTVKVEIKYITELKADVDGDAALVTIPTSVAPRYGTPPTGHDGHAHGRGDAATFRLARNGLKIEVEVSAPVPIRKLESRTHPISVELGSQGQPTSISSFRDLAGQSNASAFDPKKARAVMTDMSTVLDRDFVLLILVAGPSLLAPRALLEVHPSLPEHAVMMVSITPRDQFTSLLSDHSLRAEIIFVADRSGSMAPKLESLKTALRVFLKSIPQGCSFNIRSFGSTCSLLWDESRPYSQESIDHANQFLSTSFRADLGGTELLSALKEAVQHRTKKNGLSTELVLLTDGEVWNTEETIDFVKKTRADTDNQVRFFALGIGDRVSHRLVEGIGREGGGFAEVVAVDSPGSWEPRVIRMLKGALTPAQWTCQVILPQQSGDIIPTTPGQKQPNAARQLISKRPAIVQAPHRIPPLHAFSRSSIYFLLHNNTIKAGDTVTVTAVTPNGEKVTVNLPVQQAEHAGSNIHFLAVKAAMNDLETGHSWLHSNAYESVKNDDPTAFQQAVRHQAESLGKEWSISGRWTSFVAVDSANQIEYLTKNYRPRRSKLSSLTIPRGCFVEVQRGGCGRPLNRFSDRTPRDPGHSVIFQKSSTQSSGRCKKRDRRSEDAKNSRKLRRRRVTSLQRICPKPEQLISSKIVPLAELIELQTSDGYFDPDSSLRGRLLGTAYRDAYKQVMKDLRFMPDEGFRHVSPPSAALFQTVVIIYYLKMKHSASFESWQLAVRKARTWLKEYLPNAKCRARVEGVVREAFRKAESSSSEESDETRIRD